MAVISLPIVITVASPESITAPLSITVVPAAILSGAQSVCVSSTSAAQWVLVVKVNGVDVGDQLVGDISVNPDEGAARIADFTLRLPVSASVALAGWTGLPVTIDVADYSTGSPLYPMRLFTGVIDTPELDQAERTLTLRCTDDLQGRVMALNNAELLALIGGYDSLVVFSSSAQGWSYAQDRLSTVAASLDIGPEGNLRLTNWAPKVTPDLSFDASLILDGSMNTKIANRQAVTNEVMIEFDYRFPRVKADCYPISYHYVDMTGFAAHILAGKWWLQRDQVAAAISSAGGTVEGAITYDALPTSIIPVGSGYFTPSAADLELCMGFTCAVSFDFAQSKTEQHRIAVRNQRSIDALGLRQETISGALEGVYPDITAAETGIRLFKADISCIPPANVATPIAEKTTASEVTLTADSNRAAAEAAMRALIAVAKTKIWASHRGNRVSAAVPLNPAIDVNKTIAIACDGISARGKCISVTHRLSPSTGRATSEFSIALCSLAGYGITHTNDAIAAPAGTSPVTTDLATSASAVFLSGAAEAHTLTVSFPGVEEAERAHSITTLPTTVAAGMVEDLFTVIT